MDFISIFQTDFHLKTMKWHILYNFMECDINYKISKSSLFCYPDCITDNDSGTSLPFLEKTAFQRQLKNFHSDPRWMTIMCLNESILVIND